MLVPRRGSSDQHRTTAVRTAGHATDRHSGHCGAGGTPQHQHLLQHYQQRRVSTMDIITEERNV
ncbi:GL16440 [Drosophila persimilis]|uniref:GL16440 n=1 Tax=Drosophila persimilis TaxID=7234 RepID=B4GWH9_DROPE|nr:GL16440 [Drosophila persimilis]